jgi:DNA-directed RNA polymerase alpha subunit
MAIRICPNGHKFQKSSNCPTCPICEANKKPKEGFLASINAPARRALENANILDVSKLATYTEKDILQLHGIGISTIPKLKAALEQSGLKFKTVSVK